MMSENLILCTPEDKTAFNQFSVEAWQRDNTWLARLLTASGPRVRFLTGHPGELFSNNDEYNERFSVQLFTSSEDSLNNNY
jgi:hypothetical protein